MTDHIISWTFIGLAFCWVIGLVGVLAIASGLDWLQWFAASTLVGLAVGAGVGLATLWGETR